jgi:hypothetical protein
MNFTLTTPAMEAIFNGTAHWLKDSQMSFNSIILRKGTTPDTLDVIFCCDGVELAYDSVLMPKFEEGETLSLMGLNFTQKLEII